MMSEFFKQTNFMDPNPFWDSQELIKNFFFFKYFKISKKKFKIIRITFQNKTTISILANKTDSF